MMLNPSLVLLISIAVILVLLKLRLHAGLAIFTGCLTLIFLTLDPVSVPRLMLDALLDKQTITLLIVVPSAMALARLMEERGLLTRLAHTVESISPRLAIHLIPAFIGLVAMPAGAVVAATAVKDLSKRLSIIPEHITFINYWFRHIWEFSLPLYPTIIVTSAVLSIPLFTVVKTLLPMTALAIAAGAAASYFILRKLPKTEGNNRGRTTNILLNILSSSWPILLLIVFVFTKVDTRIAFPLTLVLLMVQQRAKWPQIASAFKYGLSPLILLLLYSVMLYKIAVESAGAADVLVAQMQSFGLPSLIILSVFPLLMGVATGYGPAFTGISMPLLLPYIVTGADVNGGALLLAYVSGMVGQLITPTHLCFVLSAQYFQASLVRVYRYLIPCVAVMESAALVTYFLLM